MTDRQLLGILNIHKPPGLTSRKAVDVIVPLVRPAKVGHAGTLDPMATGVLVVCVGTATRLIPQIQLQHKEYRARFILGRRSDTDDVTGEVVEVPVTDPVTQEQVETLLPRFVGRIEQVPPQFSAVHVEGRRAYKLARQGQAVEIAPKTVEVCRLTLTRFEYPELELEIECGSGTYIRSIGRDLGELLGCGAVMSNLVRTRIGPYALESATHLQEFESGDVVKYLLPATTAVANLPRHEASPEELEAIRHGRLLRVQASIPDAATVAVMSPTGDLACLAHYRHSDRSLAPKQVFLS